MYVLTLGVKGKQVHVMKREQLNSGSLNVDEIHFNFSGQEWDNLPNKMATFIRPDGKKYSAALTPDNRVVIPQEVYYDEGNVAIGVYGYLIEDDKVIKRLPSDLISEPIKKGAYEEGMIPTDMPTPSQWEIYVQYINELIADVEKKIPTKTSQLINDSGFVTETQIGMEKHKIEDYLYEIYYDKINYDYAYNFFKKQLDNVAPSACSSIRKGNWYGRNLDWLYDEQVDFIIHVPRINGRYASVGMCGNIALTKEMVESDEYSELYQVIPFMTLDGINEYGVFMNTNVVPQEKGVTTGTVPEESIEAEISAIMLPRYVLDHFKSATEAVEYIRKHISIYATHSLAQMGYETHFMLGDSEKTYLLETRENILYITDMTENSNNNLAGKSYMTNFYLSDIRLNDDNKVYTPEFRDGENNAETYNLISAHGSGLERYNLIVDNFANIENKEDMRAMMDSLIYTNTYSETESPFWYSEYVDGDLTVSSLLSEFSEIVALEKEKFQNRSRDPENPNYGTWHTLHSVVYDIANHKMYIKAQEGQVEHELGLEYSYTSEEIDSLLAKKQDKLVAGNNIAIENNVISAIVNNDHAQLDNLDFEHSGHTGFQPAGDYVVDLDYVHTDNNFTDSEKAKLSGIENSAEVNRVNNVRVNGVSVVSNKIAEIEVPTKTSELQNDSDYITTSYHDNTKVDKVTGKGLSTNDFTTEEKNKLAGLENYNDSEIKQSIELKQDKQDDGLDTINKIVVNAINEIFASVGGIQALIPNQASDNNQLADKDFVNSSLNSITAFYITKNAQGDPFATKAELTSTTTFYSGGEIRVPTRNDYVFVLADESQIDAITGIAPSTRYIFQNGQWEFQFIVNKTALTSEQLEAINSGITETLVALISENETNINTIMADYIKSTDYATSLKGGVIKINTNTWSALSNAHDLYCLSKSYSDYEKGSNLAFIGKGTLENVIAGKGLINENNVKTINNQSIIGSGNITIETDLSDYYTKEETDETFATKDTVNELKERIDLAESILPKNTTEKSDEAKVEYAEAYPMIRLEGDGKTEQGILPSEYQQVEYIRGTSNTKNSNYINTGIFPTNNTSIEIKVVSIYDETGIYDRLFGSSKLFACEINNVVPSNYRFVPRYNGVSNNSKLCLYAEEQILKLDKNKYYVNGQLINEFEAGVFTDTYELRILSETNGDRDGRLRIYYCKIWEDDILVRDYIPCYRKSDNAIGLFDLVQNKFYINAGTGSFEKGSDILPNPDYPQEIVNVNGNITLKTQSGDGTEHSTYIDLQDNELCAIGDVKDKLLIDRKGNVAIEKNILKINSYNGEELTGYYIGTKVRHTSTEETGELTIGDTIYYVSTPQIIPLPKVKPLQLLKGTNYVTVETNLGNMDIQVEYVEDITKIIDYNDLLNKPTIPTQTAQLTNNSGYITNSVDDLANYYTKTEIDTNYVKPTTYASEDEGGTIKTRTRYATATNTSGILYAKEISASSYAETSNSAFIGKGTLDNIQNNYVKEGIVNNTTTLTEAEQLKAQQWLGIQDGNGVEY